MKLFKIFILIILGFYFSSCEGVNEVKSIEGWWIVIPQEGVEDSFNPIWSNQDSTIVFWGQEVLEIPKGIKTPNRNYGNHLPYYMKGDLLCIFSPIEKEWQKYKIKKNRDGYQIKNQSGGGYELISANAVKKYSYPEIQEINFIVLEDSLSQIEYPKKKEYLFDFDNKLVALCYDFYDTDGVDFSLTTRIEEMELNYLKELLSRIDDSYLTTWRQRVSDVPKMELTIKFKGGVTVSFEINDVFFLPKKLKNFVSYLSGFDRYIPFSPVRECKVE